MNPTDRSLALLREATDPERCLVRNLLARNDLALVPVGRQPHGGPMTAASDRRPIHERCWCWQHGRCLTDCPTADLPPPVPMTDAHWHRAWNELRGVADR